MSRLSDRLFFMLTAMVTAIAIAVALWYIYRLYGDTHRQPEASASEEYAEGFGRGLELVGSLINPELTLTEHNKKGKLLMEGLRLGELMDGNACIVLLSTNNCQGCTRNEVSRLNRIAETGKILYIYDSPVGDYVSDNNIPASRYYELEKGQLLPGLENGQEVPVLLYVEDGKVMASCFVSNSTEPMTSEFHKFLKNRLNDEE